MARSQNSFMKKLKAEQKRKKKMEKFEKKMERKNQEKSGKLADMIAYVDADGNITNEPVEDQPEPKID